MSMPIDPFTYGNFPAGINLVDMLNKESNQKLTAKLGALFHFASNGAYALKSMKMSKWIFDKKYCDYFKQMFIEECHDKLDAIHLYSYKDMYKVFKISENHFCIENMQEFADKIRQMEKIITHSKNVTSSIIKHTLEDSV